LKTTANDLLAKAIRKQEEGKMTEAKADFHKVLKLDPRNPFALYSLGIFAQQENNLLEAFNYFKKSVTFFQGFAQGWYALGVLFSGRKLYKEAFESYDNATLINNNYTEALINKGVLHEEVKEHYKALECFEKILSYNPDYCPALCNAGIILSDFKEYELSINRFQRLVDLDPDYKYALGLLAFAKLHACDWLGYTELKARIEDGIRKGKPVCKPLAIQAITDSAEISYNVARLFAEDAFGRSNYYPAAHKPNQLDRSRKIRLAYLSPDFREHPVGQVIEGVLSQHDKNNFTLIGLSLGIDDHGALRKKIISHFDEFYDLRQLPDDHAIAQLEKLDIDILVDIAGYTADSRTALLKSHPATVQINYLGYPGSMGVNYIDYIVGDRCVTPTEDARFYSETILPLSEAYFPPYLNTVRPTFKKQKSDYGIPDDKFVYVSFCNNYKMNSDVFLIWMKILYATQNSVLWLAKTSAAAERNLREFATSIGVTADRLIFAERVPSYTDHLDRYSVCDVFLDTFPYNAHTTTQDAVFAGLPVLTKHGHAFHSRVAESILISNDCQELVARDEAEYLRMAVNLWENRGYLDQIKKKIRAQKTDGKLTSYVRDLENAYQRALLGVPRAV
jgi:protein O-GlcNAc transferase